MSPNKIQEASNGAAQLSEGRFFLMANKFRIKKGANKGEPLYVVRMSELGSKREEPDVTLFTEVKSFLLSQKEFDAWIALLIQVSNARLPEEKKDDKEKEPKKV